MRKLMVFAVLWGTSVSGVSAQAAWDSPLLLPPRPADGLGIFLTDMHGGGLGVLASWRSPIWNYGLRAGIAEGAGDDDLSIFGGVDYSGPINAATADFPIDIDWVLGAGLGVGDGVRVSFPLGLTGGHTFRGNSASFAPYITPRVVLDAWFGGDEGGQDADLDFAVDLGLDLNITGGGGPLAGTTIRFGASLGNREAVGIGLVF
ncbi:MAG: hypothetical protein WEF86_16715 [Gemmatimonadota bacterium]